MAAPSDPLQQKLESLQIHPTHRQITKESFLAIADIIKKSLATQMDIKSSHLMNLLPDKGAKVLRKIEELHRQVEFCEDGITREIYDSAAETFVNYLRKKQEPTSQESLLMERIINRPAEERRVTREDYRTPTLADESSSSDDGESSDYDNDDSSSSSCGRIAGENPVSQHGSGGGGSSGVPVPPTSRACASKSSNFTKSKSSQSTTTTPATATTASSSTKPPLKSSVASERQIELEAKKFCENFRAMHLKKYDAALEEKSRNIYKKPILIPFSESVTLMNNDMIKRSENTKVKLQRDRKTYSDAKRKVEQYNQNIRSKPCTMLEEPIEYALANRNGGASQAIDRLSESGGDSHAVVVGGLRSAGGDKPSGAGDCNPDSVKSTPSTIEPNSLTASRRDLEGRDKNDDFADFGDNLCDINDLSSEEEADC